MMYTPGTLAGGSSADDVRGEGWERGLDDP